jgi:hypothetical protein
MWMFFFLCLRERKKVQKREMEAKGREQMRETFLLLFLNHLWSSLINSWEVWPVSYPLTLPSPDSADDTSLLPQCPVSLSEIHVNHTWLLPYSVFCGLVREQHTLDNFIKKGGSFWLMVLEVQDRVAPSGDGLHASRVSRDKRQGNACVGIFWFVSLLS